MGCEMEHQACEGGPGELGSQSSSEGEAQATPPLPEAKSNPGGVLVSNPAWRKYMRKEDTWEGE